MACCLSQTLYIFLAASLAVSAVGNPGEEKPGEVTIALPGEAKMEMVWIEPGTFVMGSPDEEPERENNEGPLHEVTVGRGFWLGKYEITQSQWESVMNTRPWDNQVFVTKEADYPAVFISWEHVQDFISKLNKLDEVAVYRLPTEAEWEYACRAGTKTPYSFAPDQGKLGDYAWHGKNTYESNERYAHQVGQKLPNPWGLYDMHGNAWEWVQDYYGPYKGESQIDPQGPETGSNRVFRGGSFYYLARFIRSAYRGYNSPTHRLFNLGARIVRQEK